MSRLHFLRIFTVAVLTCSLWACGNAQSSQPPQIAIRIPLGETVDIDGVTVKFTEIREDSRCPRYTTCVWEGRARVIVEVVDLEEVSKQFMIFIGATRPDESDNKIVYTTEDLTLEVVDLKPFPGDEEPEDPPVLLIKKAE